MLADHLFTTVFCEHCGFTLSVPIYCKNRFCPTCNHHRNRLIQHKLKQFLANTVLRKFDSFKFLTLTIKNDPDLHRMTVELITAFRRLRQRSFWRKNVRGGVCVIEVKTGKDGWHVHLHIVIESGYLPFDVLLANWQAVSTGQGVYIKKIHGSRIIGYITKYLTKSEVTKAEQEEMTAILSGRRLFQPFGSWFAPISRQRKLQFDCPACESSTWFFGNRRTWYQSMSIEGIDEKRKGVDLPSLTHNQQRSLTLQYAGIPMNVD